MGNFLVALGVVVQGVLWLVMVLIIARVVISWVNADPYNQIVMIIRSATDPILIPFQRWIPPMGGLDFSPVIVLLLIQFMQIFLGNSLIQIGQSFGAR
jgi:YggT family protein